MTMTRKQKRAEIKRLLSLLSDDHRRIFKLLYAPTKKISWECSITEVVDRMPAEKLSWALTQCERSYYKLFEILKTDFSNK